MEKVYFEELKNLQEKVKEKFYEQGVDYDKTNIVTVTTFGYYSRLIEGIESVICLINRNSCASTIMAITRNILECNIDINNLQKYEEYIYYLMYISENAKTDINTKGRYYKILKEIDPDIKKKFKGCKKRRDWTKEKLQEISGEKYFNDEDIKKSVAFRFELADERVTYDGAYNLLSNDTHNNLSSIEECYININNDIRAFENLDSEFIKRISTTILVVFMGATEVIMKLFSGDYEDIMTMIRQIRYELYLDVKKNNLTFTV